MLRRDAFGLKGHVLIEVKDAEGKLKDVREFDNLVMDAGEDELALLLIGDAGGNPFSYIAIGTDSTTAADSQTALGGEISTNGGGRTQDTSPSTSGNVATVAATFNFTGPLAIQEAGLFNDASAGSMFARQTFDVINVGSGDSMTVTWNITVGTAR